MRPPNRHHTKPASPAALVRRIRQLSRPARPEPAGIQPRLRSLRHVRAVAFDVYGTLLTSGCGEVGATAVATGRCIREAFRAAGLSVEPAAGERAAALLAADIAAEHQRRRQQGVVYPEIDVRRTWRRVIRILITEGLAAGPVRADLIRRLAVEVECRLNPAWPMPGVAPTIRGLVRARLTLGIVSNAQFYTPLVLSAFPGLHWRPAIFPRDLCAWSYRLREAKPSDALLSCTLNALASRGIWPAQTLCIGNDMRNDILPASRAGCRTALFAGDARSLKRRAGDSSVRGVEPDLVLTDLTQLLQVVTAPA